MSFTLLKMPDLATTDTWGRGFKCPTCRLTTVYLAHGNYLTCSSLQCTNPDVAEVVNDLVEANSKPPKTHTKSAIGSPTKDRKDKE